MVKKTIKKKEWIIAGDPDDVFACRYETREQARESMRDYHVPGERIFKVETEKRITESR